MTCPHNNVTAADYALGILHECQDCGRTEYMPSWRLIDKPTDHKEETQEQKQRHAAREPESRTKGRTSNQGRQL